MISHIKTNVNEYSYFSQGHLILPRYYLIISISNHAFFQYRFRHYFFLIRGSSEAWRWCCFQWHFCHASLWETGLKVQVFHTHRQTDRHSHTHTHTRTDTDRHTHTHANTHTHTRAHTLCKLISKSDTLLFRKQIKLRTFTFNIHQATSITVWTKVKHG